MAEIKTSTEIAASKLRAALVSAWATIGVVALFGCLALLTPATDGPVHGILGALLLRDLTPSRVPTIILAIVLFMLVVVRARVDGIWSSVLRNHWLASIQLIGPTLAFVTLMIWNSFGNVVGYFLTVHQSEIATAAVVVKVMGVVVAFVVLKRHRLITTSTIARQVAVWLVTSIGLAALTLAAVSWTTALPMTAVALSPVLVPIVRVSLIPWAIDKARHQ